MEDLFRLDAGCRRNVECTLEAGGNGNGETMNCEITL
jgi:hypothetical protein